MKKYLPYIFALSVLANLIAITFTWTNINVTRAKPETYSVMAHAGTYGPAGREVIEGDATISAADVLLQNTLITGNLYLTEGIGEGSVNLRNVTVEGETVIRGSGANRITLQDSTLSKLVIAKKNNPVRIAAKGNTSVALTSVEGPVSLQAESLAEGAIGFADILLKTSAEVLLTGTFTSVAIESEKANVTLADQAIIDTVKIDSAATINGRGTVSEILVGKAGQVVVSGIINALTIAGEDNRLELSAGTIRELQVTPKETSTVILLKKGTTVEKMVLSGKSQVTGDGLIASAAIHAADTVIETETTPKKVVLAKGITAMVNGKELPEKVAAVPTPPKAAAPKPSPTPKPAPAPPPPPSPDSVKDFIVSEGISVGKKMVVVKLHAADPGIYTVTVGGTRLNYMASQKSFYGEVDEASANRSSVRVSQ